VRSRFTPFSHTCHTFAESVSRTLGKGYEHAALLYQEWFRTGRMSADHPSFKNAQALYQEIVDLTDLSLLPLSEEKQEGQTGKFLLKTSDGLDIESVIIPMQAGGTVCVSSQVGCRMDAWACSAIYLPQKLSCKSLWPALF
jgi:23S rRNA (adenine2503-C2)-methyltransferase